MINNVASGPLVVIFVAALPLVLVTAVLAVVVLVSLLPGDRLREHARLVIKDLTNYAAVLRGTSPPPTSPLEPSPLHSRFRPAS